MSRDDGNENNTIRVPVIAWILFIAGVFRVTAVAFLFENLQVDRDAYLAIAQNLLDGNGYCSTVNQPTAFRPPLYPLLVASCIHLGGFVLLGAAQIVLGTATVWLTWLLAIRCRLSTRTAAIAATLVAADPLLVQYTTQAMTETLATFLVTMMLVATLWSGNEIAKVGVVGVLFGLAALCRPSIWAFGMLAGAVWVVETLRTRSSDGAFNPRVSSRHAKTGAVCIFAVAITVSPWAIRNSIVFGRPILMTTHGGYTLLLGNNETFFNEVVSTDATWSASSLSDWQSENERHLSGIGIAKSDEVSRDVELSRMAKQWILSNPLKFIQTSILRFQRFWGLGPSVSTGVHPSLIQSIRGYYLCTFALAIIGLIRCRGRWLTHWTVPTAVLALTLVHFVYWSNARMRSAVVPVISLAAAAAFQRSSDPEGLSNSLE